MPLPIIEMLDDNCTTDCPMGLPCGDGKGNKAIGYMLLSRASFNTQTAKQSSDGHWVTVPVFKDSSAHLRALFAYLSAMRQKKIATGFGDLSHDLDIIYPQGQWRMT